MEQHQEIAVRDRLLEAAIGLFARKGYHATSVREIVEAAGVTKPVLYYWFGSKEGVFRELMAQAVAAHREVTASVRAHGGTAGERIVLLCERVLDLVRENAEVVRLFDAVYYGPREGAPEVDFDPLYGEFRRFVLELVEDGVRDGEFRGGDVEAMHSAVIGALMVCNTAIVSCGDSPVACTSCDKGMTDVRRVLGIVLEGMRAQERNER